MDHNSSQKLKMECSLPHVSGLSRYFHFIPTMILFPSRPRRFTFRNADRTLNTLQNRLR